MMLKQSASRNVRAKSLKVKHAIWIFVLLAVCIWFIYQVKNGAFEKRSSTQVKSRNGEHEYQILKIGRKDLKPRRDDDDVSGDLEKEIDDEESKEVSVEEIIQGGDKEPEQLQDFIDEDDKDG